MNGNPARHVPRAGGVHRREPSQRSVPAEEWMEYYLAHAPTMTDEALDRILELYDLEQP